MCQCASEIATIFYANHKIVWWIETIEGSKIKNIQNHWHIDTFKLVFMGDIFPYRGLWHFPSVPNFEGFDVIIVDQIE